jgi:hypothetical protein
MASELLDYVLDAHGGLNRWNELSGLSGDVSRWSSLPRQQSNWPENALSVDVSL